MEPLIRAALALALTGVVACRGDAGEARVLERAEEASRRVAAAEWRYDRELLPPERAGGRGVRHLLHGARGGRGQRVDR
jgi:hypothetical protein